MFIAVLSMFILLCVFILLGTPVAFALSGVALFSASLGVLFGVFDANLLFAYPDRVLGIISNTTLMAVPLFVLMGVFLERAKVAEQLLSDIAKLCGRLPAGLAISVVIVGSLLAASTGIVGATVVTMGLMSLPTLLKRGFHPAIACGTICATGTLGQIIPPSIALVLLGDILANAYQQAQLDSGIFNPKTISVGDLFVGAVIPGLLLVGMYITYLLGLGILKPSLAPAITANNSTDAEDVGVSKLLIAIAPPLILIALVLGSIIFGIATPTEAAAIGASAAALMGALRCGFSHKFLHESLMAAAKITAMVFAILLGASLFSLVFRGFGGEALINSFFYALPGGTFTAILIVMVVIFLLGFILDFIEICFIVVPIVGPAMLQMGVDPIWLAILIAVNLQTSFLTPPFGFALFYLRGVAPKSVKTSTIYQGVLPFIVIQLIALLMLSIWPELVTWLPNSIG